MDRNREARRGSSIVGSNGFNKRRHRTNSLRDSPDEDGGIELQESARLRDRVKKDRDRDRERERERERDRERERERERDLRERSSRTNKRRRTNNREDIGGDETTDESFNEDDDDDDDDEHAIAATGVRLFPPPLTAAPGSISNHHNHHHHHSFSTSFSQQQQHNSSSGNIMSSNNNHLQHRKSFPLSSSSAKALRAPPVWKSGDEMISASVPRKARSACTKRLHDWISSSSNNNSGGGGGGVSGGEPNLGQVSDSPVRQTPVSTSPPPPTPAAPPMSPSSSNASARKKLKPSVSNSGPKPKPQPKVSSSKPSSSNPEELEIEIAEVLYGLMTQSQGPSRKEDSREVNNPISGPNSAPLSAPLSAVAPKRKRPRQIPENSIYSAQSVSVSVKPEADQMSKSEISSPNLEKISGSGAEVAYDMGGISIDSHRQMADPPLKSTPESSTKLDLELKPVSEELRENRDLVAKEETSLPKERESSVVRTDDSNSVDLQTTLIKENSMVSQVESQKEEKFEIDLMAPPPQAKSSPERENKINSNALAVDPKPVFSINDAPSVKKDIEDEKCWANVGAEETKGAGLGEEAESQKAINNKGRNIDLHLDLEKSEGDSCAGVGVNETVHKTQKQHHQQQMPFKATKEEPLTEKSGHLTSSLPLPLSVGSWPPMGYMAPLQGVVSIDGAAVTPAHMQPLFTQPRPKRCATHCHIARNIHCLQQFMKMNPFWPGPAAPASLFGSNPCNLNVIPAQDLITVKGGNSNSQDNKVPSPNLGVKDKTPQPTITSDSSQRKQQILIQQPLPPSVAPPTNLMGPTFIFPLSQQQPPASVAAKSQSGGASTTSATSASAASAPMSFNFPNMASANETQYLAILQNNGYPFPMPSVGAPPNYRGAAMPLFNGSFYSPQMIHPSQLQHPQQFLQQAHQNATVSSNSSSSQKQLLQQQQQQNQSSNKTPPPQQYVHPSRPRQFEGEDSNSNNSPSNTDGSRGYRPPVNIYGQNFAMMHPQNFAMMTNHPTAGNQNEKKGHQGSKGGGVESLPPQHSFAMSFGPINGSSGSDMVMSSMAQNHALFQSSAEASSRQNIQMMAASQVAHKKSFRISEDGKSGSADSSVKDDERKGLAGKAVGGGGGGQSIAFTRADSPVSTIKANNSVIDNSARSLNNASSSAHNVVPMSVQNANIQARFQQQQQQQQMMMQIKQQQLQLSASRSKAPPANNSNGNNNNIYTDQLNPSSSTVAAKFPNVQNLVQSSNGGSQSPQWRSSTRTQPSSQTPSSLAPPSTLKNLPQQQSRTQPQMMHTQISFSGGNQKLPSATSQGGQLPPSSPMMVGSPTTSSVSKGGPSGSPRTTSSASTSNKTGQGVSSSFSTQSPNQRTPSILGNPTVSSGSKTQMPKTMQQAQMFFSNMYNSQSQSPQSSGPAPYYTQRRRQDQQHQQAAAMSMGPAATSASSGPNTNDPAVAIAAATKGGGLLPSQGVMHALLPAGFSYVHPVPVKPAEQKQSSGNDNLHQWQPEKK